MTERRIDLKGKIIRSGLLNKYEALYRLPNEYGTSVNH